MNQKSAIDSGIPLDIIDLAIIDYSKGWFSSRKTERITTPEGEFFWIDYKTLIKNMPILGINSVDGISRRFTKLVKYNVLDKFFDKKTNRAFFRFGVNYDLLEWDSEGTDEKSDGTDGESEGYGGKVGQGTDEKSYNNIPLRNKTLKKNNKELKKEEIEEMILNSKTPKLAAKLFEFLSYRRSIKKPIKEASQQAFIRKLEELSGNNEDIAVAILEQSIANGWQGIFPLKNSNINSGFNQKVGVAQA